ncbi:MAG: ABC transporter permease [Candidatus Hodarchaeota archaeon]
MSEPTIGYNWKIVWARFKKNKRAVVGLGIIIAIVFIATFAPFLAPFDPMKRAGIRFTEPLVSQNILGTDDKGRDVLSMMIWGARTALLVGILASTLTTSIGVLAGAAAGYFRGIIEEIILRVCESLLVIPNFFLYILVLGFVRERGPLIIVLIIALTRWPRLTRIVRAEFLSLKERDYVVAAKIMGASRLRMIFRHLIPNAISPIIVYATMDVAAAIILESAISFVGLGDPMVVSWGETLSAGREYLGVAYWIATFPGFMIFLTVMGFNFLGDGLRDSLDPRLRGTI